MNNEYTEKIVNAVTGEETFREYTKEEITEVEAVKAKAETQRLSLAAKAHERAALLERLGITEDEARLLLGGN